VEHPCHRCGSPVQDSSAFCPDCGAPQVRFSRNEPADESVSISLPAGALPDPPPAQSDAQIETNRRVSDRERGIVFRSALKGGGIAAALCLLPMGFVLAMPLAGFLAVFFHGRQSWRAKSSRRSGFMLGALAGLFAFLIFGLLVSAQVSSPSGRNEFRSAMVERLQNLESNYKDPEQRKMIEYFMSPQGMPLFLLMMGGFLCGLFVFLSGVGGAISAGVLRRKGPPS
jgi:predicted  nucleic acid-binding Zn-ribbon protein